MHRSSSGRGRSWLVVGIGLAAIANAGWFLPPLPDRTIQPVHVALRAQLTGQPDGLTIFDTLDGLRRAFPDANVEQLPNVDWKSTNLVFAFHRARGYMTEGDTEPRFGFVSYCSRLGSREAYFYFEEPTPYWFAGEIRSVFNQIHREQWFVVAKGTNIHWNDRGTLTLIDMGLILATGLLLFAWLRTQFCQWRSKCSAQFRPDTLQTERVAGSALG